jgi:hypothetical protein
MCVLVAASQNSSPRGDGASMPWNSETYFRQRVFQDQAEVVRVNIRRPVRHRAAGEINKWEHACENVVQKNAVLSDNSSSSFERFMSSKLIVFGGL